MITSLNFQVMHHGVGVGKPLQDKSVANYITRRRGRYGTEIVDQTNVRQTMEYYHQHQVPVAYMMLSDQSPSNPKKCFVTDFLHQRSGILFGAEHFAKKYDLPVVYYEVVKDRIGHYHLEFELITEKPNETEHGYITDRYVQLLEQSIRKQPAYWLWSHRRWKHDFSGTRLEEMTG